MGEQLELDLRLGEIVVDGFCGGGGASTGIELAMGRSVDIAINHSPEAIAVHTANHPTTEHYLSSIYEVDPVKACDGRPVGLAWFSPDCTHFSKAKSGKPRSKNIRSLAWVVIEWARKVAPRVIMLENVEEFQGWGPLCDEGKPIREQAGETFQAWLGALRDLGYAVEHRVLVAADYGAPTTRKRFFLIARRDGKRIVWPEPTHGEGRAHAWRPASSIIDWTIPAPSIFERKRPLAPATLRRIAVGVRRYVLESPAPFIVKYYGTSTAEPLSGPLSTVTAGGVHHGLVAPTLIQTGYGERKGQAPRVLDLGQPLGTVVAGGSKHGLVTAFLTKHYSGVVGGGVTDPIGTVTTQDHHAVTTATLEAPGAGHAAEVRALLDRYPDLGPSRGRSATDATESHAASEPTDGMVSIGGARFAITDIGMRMLQPRELFAAQGFPSSYVIDPVVNGKRLGSTKQIALAGNSVPPALARALVAANMTRVAPARRWVEQDCEAAE